MAASHRTPLMRDQWRSGDKYQDDSHYSGRGHSGHRQESPSASKRQSDTDIGVKIRGRAAAGSNTRPSSRGDEVTRHKDLRQEDLKYSRRSPQRRLESERFSRRPRDSSPEQHTDPYPDQHQYQDKSRVRPKRRTSRSRTPREISTRRRGNQRSRSPFIFDRTSRAPSIRSRHLERACSPRASVQGDYYSAEYDNISTSRSIRDHYIPSSRRSRSPAARRIRSSQSPATLSSRPSRPIRQRSRSRSQDRRQRERSSTRFREEYGGGKRSARKRVPRPSNIIANPHSRDSSQSRHQIAGRRRRESRLYLPVDSNRAKQKREHSRSPPRSGNTKSKRKMQSSTHPIQSILDDGSRPPSPPRPIASFDSDSHNPNTVREAYPMHGMKAHGVHGDSRSGRPQIDTRHSYNTSPQWTPSSSHHGSPQSGSPFSHGRGGWGGPQQFHSQQGYNILLFLIAVD